MISKIFKWFSISCFIVLQLGLSINLLFAQESVASIYHSTCNEFDQVFRKDISKLQKLSSKISYEKFKSITKTELLGGKKSYDSIFVARYYPTGTRKFSTVHLSIISVEPIILVDSSESIRINVSPCSNNNFWFTKFEFTDYKGNLSGLDYDDFIEFDSSIVSYYRVFKYALIDRYTGNTRNVEDSLMKYRKYVRFEELLKQKLEDSTVARLIVNNPEIHQKISTQEKKMLFDFFYSWFHQDYERRLLEEHRSKNKVDQFIKDHLFPFAQIKFVNNLIGFQIKNGIVENQEYGSDSSDYQTLFFKNYHQLFDSRIQSGLRNIYNYNPQSNFELLNKEFRLSTNNLYVEAEEVFFVSQRPFESAYKDTVLSDDYKKFKGLHIYKASFKLPVSRGRNITFSQYSDLHINNNILFGVMCFRIFKPGFLTKIPKVEVVFDENKTKYYRVKKLKRILSKYGYETITYVLPEEYEFYQYQPFCFREKLN